MDSPGGSRGAMVSRVSFAATLGFLNPCVLFIGDTAIIELTSIQQLGDWPSTVMGPCTCFSCALKRSFHCLAWKLLGGTACNEANRQHGDGPTPACPLLYSGSPGLT